MRSSIRVLASLQDKLILGAYENVKPEQLAYQYDFLGRLRAPVGYLNLNRDRDDVVRSRAPPPADARFAESFSARLASAAGRKQPATPERIAWLLPPADGSSTFLRIEAHKLLDTSTDEAARLKDRVVIIAGEFPYFDRHRTPLSLPTGTEMTGAEIHAQMAAELIDGHRSYSELTPLQARAFLAGLAAVAVLLGWRFQARRFDVLDWRVASFAVVAAAALVFKFAHLILPFTLAAFAWVLAITLGTQTRGAAAGSRTGSAGVVTAGALRGPRTRPPRFPLPARITGRYGRLLAGHPRTGLSDGDRSRPLRVPVPSSASVAFALRRYVRPRNSAIIPATQQSIFFWLCSTAQPDSCLFDNRGKAAAAGETGWFRHCRARCQRKRAGLGVRCVRTHGTPRCFWMSARDRLYAQSVLGRSGIGYSRQALIISDDDLGADHDHLVPSAAELPLTFLEKDPGSAQLRLRKVN
jgi:hypothetical protein